MQSWEQVGGGLQFCQSLFAGLKAWLRLRSGLALVGGVLLNGQPVHSQQQAKPPGEAQKKFWIWRSVDRDQKTSCHSYFR